ncbi:MarR family transcriptional regulator [Microbacteriaceae bacterium VKM Ac-2854]|nr:MarR family transcriptional regulator [Microbacteriaceae bacterium VKM Ac-2854]
MQTRSQHDRRELELALGESINALLSATRALSERSAASFHEQLQPAAFHIARWLHAFGPAKPSVIADALAMDRSSTSTLIGRMRTLGLVESTPDPGDRRGVIVGLSPSGDERVTRTLAERGDEFGDRVRDWSDPDVRTLTELLERLTRTPTQDERPEPTTRRP